MTFIFQYEGHIGGVVESDWYPELKSVYTYILLIPTS